MPKIISNCKERGVVMVKIKVNQSGKVMQVISGVKGSTTLSNCLLKEAEELALNTIWNGDSNAPFEQIGFQRIVFE
nr:hypothetical protein [uncultured Psychroserpens sp.]